MTSRTLDEGAAATLLLKAENLQRAGAFKFLDQFAALIVQSSAS